MTRAKRQRKWTPERMAEVKAMLAEGKTIAECAAVFGASFMALRQTLRVFGRENESDLGKLPVPPRILAPWPRWGWFGVSRETRARLRDQYPDG